MSAFNYDTIAASVTGTLEDGVETSIRHNLAILRAIHWGARQVSASTLEFDPRADWWYRPERRFAIAFLSDTWKDWHRDAAQHPAIEDFCVALCSALDGLRERGEIDFRGVDYERGGGRAQVLAPIRALVSSFAHEGWPHIRPPKKYGNASAGEALLAYLSSVERDGFSKHERSLQELMRWWGAIGARSSEDLRARQHFFWLYRLLLCTSNAYINAGAQYFGPVIGNTKVSLFREVIRRWREGATLAEVPLMALDKDRDDVFDRSHTNIVRELWGFLNLERGPFYNTQAEAYLEYAQDPIEATQRIGAEAHAWLDANPQREDALAMAFERWLPKAQRAGNQPLARVRRYDRKIDDEGEASDAGGPLDEQLNRELREQGTAYLLEHYPMRERACVMLHLALDASVRPHGEVEPPVEPTGNEHTYAKPSKAGVSVATDGPSAPLVNRPDAAAILREAKTVWIYAPGTQADAFVWDLKQNVARIYWDQLGDLSAYASKPALHADLEFHRGEGARAPINDSNTVWAFGRKVKIGDVLIARRGLHRLIGVGRVTKPYYHATGQKHPHCLGVDWVWTGELVLTSGKGLAWPTFVRGTQRKVLLEQLLHHIESEGGDKLIVEPTPPPAAEPFGIDKALEQLFFTRAEIEKWQRLLERRRNLVLTGPPGVGKTFVAKRLARLITGEASDAGITVVQFHQAYTYEQFVLGYRPAGGGPDSRARAGEAKPQFELAKGPLFRLAEQALRDEDAKFVLIIDEINRGNISRILGEALMLLEADKRAEEWGLELAYTLGDSEFPEGRFYLPPNLYVIGTMNTADRSLAVVDYALRRRFAFVDVTPRVDSAEFAAFARSKGLPEVVLTRLCARVKAINERICNDRALGSGFSIGHSFFTASDGAVPWAAPEDEAATSDAEALGHAWLDDVFEYEIEPLLREYWVEDPEQLDAVGELLWKDRVRA